MYFNLTRKTITHGPEVTNGITFRGSTKITKTKP
jgi:hypothetical protein